MIRGARLAHVLGLVMMLGSILTFLVVSTVIQGGSVESVALGRRIISAGTNVSTLPGMGVLAASGIWMGLRLHGARSRFFQLELLLLVLIALNGAVFVAPSVSEATELAVRSLAHGTLLPEYAAAYARESTFGAVNVALMLAAAVVRVWKPGAHSPPP